MSCHGKGTISVRATEVLLNLIDLINIHAVRLSSSDIKGNLGMVNLAEKVVHALILENCIVINHTNMLLPYED